jgi:DegV family protein with EDD domain
LGISFNSATQAKQIAQGELPQTKIAVVDSSADIGGQMLIVLEAAKAASEGRNLQYLIKLVKKRISEINWIVLFDTLDFIVKGGRGATASSWQSSALTIKMIMELDASTRGKYTPLLKVRTKSQGKAKMLEIMKERNKNRRLHAVVCYQKGGLEEAKELREEISSQSHCVEFYAINPALVQAIHLGPGALGLGWYSED